MENDKDLACEPKKNGDSETGGYELAFRLTEYINTDKNFREALRISPEKKPELTGLGQGECNINYSFLHPETGKKLVLRVNIVSQMHLENQTGYEYAALEFLQKSGRTPTPLFKDDTKKNLPYGIIVYEFLPGRPLEYEKDLKSAAAVLADIHSVPGAENTCLIKPEDPCEAMLSEFGAMFGKYTASALCDKKKARKISEMLETVKKRAFERAEDGTRLCCINTELNSGNFLINSSYEAEKKAGEKLNFLIDWEKPLYSEPAQDLGHFLAPTTTFWKTDSILTKEEIDKFIDFYLSEVNGRFDTKNIRENAEIFIPLNCMRGITWSSMAWVDYQDENSKNPKNESTWKKLNAYLGDDFLDMIEKTFLN